ncbi:hypothetical protein K5X82_15100 [Halosquirtibacter xylanolyticus]|uniref:glycine betaine ABC transporter substrate-binding protein n=1 Tax=Halosquirtibacter xylanolyticus TaxID=3374599 RepID=UPI00374970BE|nr:hypothetical protein K5X82_15100 [Prolixibacteraceae bacterium]
MNFRLSLLFVLCLFGCSTKTSKKANPSENSKPDVVIGSVPWAEDIAITRFTKKIIESKGYTVKIKTVANLSEALTEGEIDISITGWFPQNVHVTTNSEQVVIGDLYQNAQMGVLVPSYSTLNSLTDLENNSKYKDITIFRPLFGTESEHGLNEVAKRYSFHFCNEEKIESETALHINAKYSEKQDFFIVGGHPHPMFNKKYIKMLDDPYHAFEDSYDIVKICSKKWSENHPNLFKFFQQYQLDDKDFDKLIVINELNGFNMDPSLEQWFELLQSQFSPLLEKK